MTDTKTRQQGINLVACSAESITRLLDEHACMKAALEYYADPKLYQQADAHNSMGHCCAIDRGATAKAVINSLSKEKE